MKSEENIFFKRLKAYYQLTKPRTVLLLEFVVVATGLLLYQESNFIYKFFTGSIALLFAISGTNAVTNWIDRDIDTVMERTSNRPLPKGDLSPRAALLFGLSAFSIGCLITSLISPKSIIFLILGFMFSAVIYNGYLKRRSPLNILFASPAGMMPVLFMWHLFRNEISLIPVLLGTLVILWTPAHIWSLAIFYASDYGRAKIPMLPLIAGEVGTSRIIAFFNLLLTLVSSWISVAGFFGKFYFVSVLILNTVLLTFTMKVLLKPIPENSLKLFKFSSPYLALLFLIMVIDRLLFPSINI